MTDRVLQLKIQLVEPPINYAFCLQRGKGAKSERLDYIEVLQGEDRAVEFDLEVTVRKAKDRPDPDFFGPFAQGRAGARYFYLCVGAVMAAGDPQWSGRVKVPLTGIEWSIIDGATMPDRILFAQYQASTSDGRPVYASVPLLGDGWTIQSED